MKIYRILRLLVGTYLFIFSIYTDAAWQVAKPAAVIPREPFFQASAQGAGAAACSNVKLPNQYAQVGRAPIYAVSISGSLKENIERIMGRYHWKVVWKAPYDYNFDGRVTGTSLPNVVEKLFQPFPLQAVMYMSNRTLAIVPRTRIGRDKC